MKAQISLSPDGRLLVEFPSCDAWAEHSVLLPASASGVKHIATMLAYQETGAGKLAMNGAPIQAVVNAWLKQNKEKRDAELLGFAKGVDL